MTEPKVSVCVVAYNQASFIGPCLDGLLAQDCAFPYEIIVGDDGSTDGTAQIIADYARRHPDKIKAVLHPKNLGTTRNYLSIHNAARGEFVAHMDGDDLAYPAKLRRQVEIFEANPKATVCVHDMDNLHRGQLMQKTYKPTLQPWSTLDDLVGETYFFAHSSKMYRRSAALTKEWPGREILDLYFHFEHAAAGGIVGTPELLGAYRMHVGVSMGSLKTAAIVHTARLEALQRAAELGASPDALRRGHVQARFIYALKFLKFGDRKSFREYIRLRPGDYRHARGEHVKLSLFRHVPWYLDRYLRQYEERVFKPRMVAPSAGPGSAAGVAAGKDEEGPKAGLVTKARSMIPRGAVPAVLARISSPGLAFLSTLILARILGPEGYGAYALAVSLLGLLSLSAQLGLVGMTPRNLGVYLHEKDWPHAFAFIRWTTRVVLVMSTVGYGLAAIALAWNPMAWTQDQVAATRVILLAIPFAALLRLSRARLQAMDKTAVGLFFETPFWNTLLVVSGLAAALVPALQTSVAVSALHVACFAVAWLGAHIAVQRNLPPKPARLEAVKVGWLHSGAFFTLLGAVGYVLRQGDLLLVGTFLADETTGHYSVALRSAGLTLLILQPLQQVAAPRIAKAWSRGDRAEVVHLARRNGQLSLVTGIPTVVFFWVFGDFFLSLFGPSYQDALWALRWLSLAQVMYIAIGPGSMVLQMIHDERSSLYVNVASVAVGIPLSIWMMLQYGIAGAGLAKVITLVGAALGSNLILRVRHGLNVSPLRFDKPAAGPKT